MQMEEHIHKKGRLLEIQQMGKRSPPGKLVKSSEVLVLILAVAGDYFTSCGHKEKTQSGAGGTLASCTRQNKVRFTKGSPSSAVPVT